MSILPLTPSIPVDADTDETIWVRLELARIDAGMRTNPLWSIPRAARWVLLGYDPHGGRHLLGSNLDVLNLLALARAVASANRASFDEPAATCRWCAMPVPVGYDFCPDADCHLSHGANEPTWRVVGWAR
jgi:hypothetical protein